MIKFIGSLVYWFTAIRITLLRSENRSRFISLGAIVHYGKSTYRDLYHVGFYSIYPQTESGYKHAVPLGLEDLDIPPGYKHAAPLGLKTRYPVSTFFHDSLVYERQPQL